MQELFLTGVFELAFALPFEHVERASDH